MKKAMTIGAVILTLLLFATTAYAYYIYRSLDDTVDKINQPLKRQRAESEQAIEHVQKAKPISILLLGVDERKKDKGRSDTMIVVTVNPDRQSVKMLSIPRDTRTLIPGRYEDKINAAYAYGGVDLSVETVEQWLDIPIDYYVKINMEGLEDLIDAIGGVTVDNELAFNFKGYDFPLGEVALDGKKALRYVQMRKQDPNGDFGREERQRKVVKAIAAKEMSLSGINHLEDVLSVIGDNVRTNLTFDEMQSLYKNCKTALDQIDTLELKGDGGVIGGLWYYLVPDEEVRHVSDLLKEHLDLSFVTKRVE